MKQIDQLIINSPYREPTHYWDYDRVNREFEKKEGRRKAGYLIANPRAKGFDDPGQFIEIEQVNNIREALERWKKEGMPGITGTTRKLIDHWYEGEERRFPFFFCQLEAIETIIFLNEAPPAFTTGIDIKSDGGPFIRWCNKMATGSGKTILASMIIAYNILNKVAYKQDKRFSKNVLIVAPGLTVKSRLSVLQPSAEDNYFQHFGVVPSTMMDKLRQGRIQIINWHKLAWNTQEKIDKKIEKGQLRSVDKRQTIEMSDRSYAKMVLGYMSKAKNILVINDEAHHAWRTTPESKKGKVKAEDVDNTIWVGGLDKLDSHVGILRCHDLSATPFVPTGKKANDQGLFSWIVSDFGLNDAIETGLVKTPRVVIRDDGKVDPKSYQSRLFHIYEDPEVKTDLNQKKIPKETMLPDLLKNAYELLALDWLETKKEWMKKGLSIPPVMITVANTTETSARIKYHFDSGKCSIQEISDPTKTLQIDSSILGKIENEDSSLSGSKKELAEQLREKVDTVGKIGKPGEQIQNVISVGMLSEGWDASNVTQIMGLRAFSSQLLCEQVVGRGLRRVSYEFDENGMLSPEYVNIFGVPFTFLPHEGGGGAPQPPKPKTLIEPTDEKLDHRIEFPNVLRIDTVYKSTLEIDYEKVKPIIIDPADNITEAEFAGVLAGKTSAAALSEVDLKQLSENYRLQTLIFKVATNIFEITKPNWKGDQYSFLAQLIKITEEFIKSDRIVIKTDLFNQDVIRRRIVLMLNMSRIVQHFWTALKSQNAEKFVPIFDKEKAFRSTADMPVWFSSKPNEWHKKSHINYTVFDSSWEANNAKILENHPSVKSFAKNNNLGFKIKYKYRGVVKNYLPDYIIELQNGEKIILEVKGQNSDEVRAKLEFLDLWVKGVNEHGGFGKWHWAIVFNSSEIHDVLNKYETFPRKAFLEQKDPLAEDVADEISTEVVDFYEVPKELLLKEKNVQGMINVVIKTLVEKNFENIYSSIAESIGESDADIENLEKEQFQDLIYKKLDGLAPQSIEKYKTRVRNHYPNFKYYDRMSFDYLTSGEFMYDSISSLKHDDYSPFVIQVSRAIENELKEKLFVPFSNYQNSLPGRLVDAYEEDLKHKNTEPFAKMLIHNNTNYTIGFMYRILRMTSGDLVDKSFIIQDFYNYILDEYDLGVTRDLFLIRLQRLKDEFRNKSAHTSKMDADQAMECRILVRDLLHDLSIYHRKGKDA